MGDLIRRLWLTSALENHEKWMAVVNPQVIADHCIIS